MNIWDAYCKPDYYNIYFDMLVAKGMKRETAETIKSRYRQYIQRIKSTSYANRLKRCSTPDEFLAILHELFYEKWKNHLKFAEMPAHFDSYMSFLDSMQALHGDFINDEEKCRIISRDPEIPVPQLTHFETDYICDGKLKALMNPQLLHILKKSIEGEGMKPVRGAMICEAFYSNHLPLMSTTDYVPLINYLWSNSRQVKKGGKHNQFRITTPDGSELICTTTDGLKFVIKYYGVDSIAKCRLIVRNNDFWVKIVPMGKEKDYEKYDDTGYFCVAGNTEDRLKLLRAINILNGKKLTINLT